MFTVCPKCALTLVVTAADLRVAQGYVRCGRCSNVFNALSRLSEDRAAATAAQPQASPQPPPPPKAPPPAPPQQQVAPASSPSSEPMRYDDDSAIPEEDLEFNPDGTDLNKVFVEQPPSPQFTAATGTFKAIRLEAQSTAREDQLAATDEHEAPRGTDFDPTDTQVDVEIDPDLLASMARMPAQEPLKPTPPAAPHREPATPKAAPPEPARPKPAPPPPKQPPMFQPPLEQPPREPEPMRLAERAKARAEAARTGDTGRMAALTARPEPKPKAEVPKPDPAPRPAADLQSASAFATTQAIRDALAPRKRSTAADPTSTESTPWHAGMWTAGSAVLVLLLLIQVVHHYRDELATNPTLNGPLTGIYAVLGIPIVPRWDLGSYEVRQLGASTAGENQIRVAASVKNIGHQAQPLPLLRVTIQDRFGNRIASQDVPPQSYLPRAIPSSSLLSSGQRIDAEMTFVDPGSNAVGFEIDACLPAAADGIACSNDIAH
jgi:predicted Zn finger-like uncharacterized protein